jgi:hypothetical protein
MHGIVGDIADALQRIAGRASAKPDRERRASLESSAPSLIECPIDYRENQKLSEALGEIICRG